ncbi:adenine DNA glycosylase [Corythoichthys intestinalis]|uniref:adenine DNA glycosylase n=1 Tax=Corythoichthys intestinalis TaxID=161448 RepID=UPI0025A6564C|nr:adenine DNA glycosylase [Corythoichthys intestinalis]XP_061790434.1 adenine DNA glycosylase-like [Nerophis lumbriciformis]
MCASRSGFLTMRRIKKEAVELVEDVKPKRKRQRTRGKIEELSEVVSPSAYHTFHDPAEICLLRTHLLSWYDLEKRELPWRTLALTEPDVNIRTYAVWVSEIMLQQTQVATVIDYYKKWIKRWPTVADLAAATLEEVNQMWAGLGYYSRGKRLHEGAQKVVSELDGRMPDTVDELLKQLPGVGRYTAAAIGSISLGQVTGAVDGNVIRVLCRMRAIGADCTSPAVTEALWVLANTLVDPERAGDFNQAMMELGARVCTPKGPLCKQCPVRSHCHSYRKVHAKQEQNAKRLLGKKDTKPPALPDIEDCSRSSSGAGVICPLCPTEPWNEELGVQNFPRKPAKKPPRVERTWTCVLTRHGEDGEEEFLLMQRPKQGLLAGLWEFPGFVLEKEDKCEKKHKVALCDRFNKLMGVLLIDTSLQYVGEVRHLFSHIHQTYEVHTLRMQDTDMPPQRENVRWVNRSALEEAAVSTGVKKILKLCDSAGLQKETTSPDAKRLKNDSVIRPRRTNKAKMKASSGSNKQLSLTSFFRTTKQEP